VALISGGARGMGESEARLFAREGARVVIGDILEAEGRAVEAGIRADGGDVLFLRLDVTDEADWDRAVAQTIERFGKLNVLVNNAGVGAVGRIEDTTTKDWDHVMDINAKGVFLGMRHVIPMFLEQGGGVIVNTASMAAQVAFPQLVAYCGSKGAVLMMTKTAAVEYADKNIRVNCFCPGAINTNMVSSMPKEYIDLVIQANPVKRIGEPREIADLALFLASDESSFITGIAVTIDGGYTAL
jgi:NAD(P)-dependent dehydrogenase (short-subunit alcohol dehydrogenase family)